MREAELRLALVCYGGISLAVYMHGITKELWHLARASCARHNGTEAPSPLAEVYAELLDEIAGRSEVRLRVLIDIVAGASAGGINGIFLGQAIAAGQSLEPLTDMWLEKADVEALIDAAAAPPSRFSKVWALPLAWMAAGRSEGALEDADESTRDEVRRKLSHFVRSRWFEPPFSGAGFTNMLLDAFDAMASSQRGPRLLPNGQPLDLFVTVTDFTGHPERLKLHSPPEVVETEHRLVIAFSDHGGRDTLADPAELTFASRATSSFPGAFPPLTVGEIDGVLKARGQKWPTRGAFLQRVLPRQCAIGTAERTALLDGSVLANAPFGPAIDALNERPARRAIDRRILYIDPSPGARFALTGESDGGPPGFFQTILGSASELPRQQPIRDNLEAIAGRSARIERMREIVSAIRAEVEEEVEAALGRTFFLDSPTPARLVSWRRRAQQGAASRAGYSHAAYGHLKLAGVVDLVTGLLYAAGGEPGPQRWRGIRARIAAEVAARGLDEPEFAGGARPGTIAFLRQFDLAFRIRRLRLLGRRLTEIPEVGDALEPVREAVFESLGDYVDCRIADRHANLRGLIRSRQTSGAELLDRLAESMDLTRLDAETDARLAAALSGLPRETRRALLLQYLGFPYFDVATLPLLQGEGLDEFDPIKVDRISPEDCSAIRAGGAEATLKGIQFNKFGAFFSRAYRENDYLWGRLHGAERAIDIVLSTLPADRRLRAGKVAAIKRRAFLAILDEEEPRLTSVPGLIERLRGEIG
jgi:patatin-related protein